MTTLHEPIAAPFTRFASCPGGTARQFRVQVYQSPAEGWHLWATFAERQSAASCWQQLIVDGYDARILECWNAPVGI